MISKPSCSTVTALILGAILLSSCATKSQDSNRAKASVRTDIPQSASVRPSDTSRINKNAQNNSGAPVVMMGQGGRSAGFAVVEPYDNLWLISKRFNLPMRDIIALNKLKAPFTVHPYQRLKLPPPREYKVREGDSLYKISRLFQTDMNAVARLNNMRAPFTLQPGQILRMPSSGTPQVSPKVQEKRIRQASKQAEKDFAFDPKQAEYVDLPEYTGPDVLTMSGRGAAAPKPVSKPAHLSKDPVNARPVSITPKAVSQKPSRAARHVKKALDIPARSASARFLKPVEGRIISSFGPKSGGLHNDGINIAAPHGASVRAAENGVVAYVGDEIEGFGNLVLIRHEGQFISAYAHLKEAHISVGQKIKRGQIIANVGSTGSVNSPQLHFEIRKGAKALNPKDYIGANM